jgi:choline dehydrogenase-like flavoprotein
MDRLPLITQLLKPSVQVVGVNAFKDTKRGFSGSIQVSYLAITQENPLVQAWNNAFKAIGYEPTVALYTGKSIVTPAYTAAIVPVTGHWSDSAAQYGIPASQRSNVTIATGTTVGKFLFEGASPIVIATGVEIAIDGKISTVKARNEGILSADAFHAPKLLEHSGVGNKGLLTHLGIPLVIDNPSVGELMQNHVMSVLGYPLNPDFEVAAGIQALTFTRLPGKDEKEPLDKYSSATSQDQARHNVIRKIIESPDEASGVVFLGVHPGDVALLGLIPGFPF